jgi:hypothetical protein
VSYNEHPEHTKRLISIGKLVLGKVEINVLDYAIRKKVDDGIEDISTLTPMII